MNSEIAATLARFFEQGRGPSHDELSRLFQRAGLEALDPAYEAGSDKVGKLKRVRGVLLAVSETSPTAALDLTRQLISTLRARGSFDADSEHFAGTQTIAAAQRALLAVGWRLQTTGTFYPVSLGGLEGRALTEALESYVRRIQLGADDAALTIGTAKELLEAAARHALVASFGTYDERQGFASTVFRAMSANGSAVPSTTAMNALDEDPYAALEQALVLAALAINRLRNLEGTGHGRPHPTKAQRRQGVIAAQAAAAICYALVPDLLN